MLIFVLCKLKSVRKNNFVDCFILKGCRSNFRVDVVTLTPLALGLLGARERSSLCRRLRVLPYLAAADITVRNQNRQSASERPNPGPPPFHTPASASTPTRGEGGPARGDNTTKDRPAWTPRRRTDRARLLGASAAAWPLSEPTAVTLSPEPGRRRLLWAAAAIRSPPCPTWSRSLWRRN